MADILTRLEDEIAEKRAKLAGLQEELEELETAARVLRRYQESAGKNGQLSPSQPPSPPQEQSTKTLPHRKTVRELAVEILTERGPMHYKEVAAEAVRRGFVSHQSSDPDAPARTFMTLFYREPETFPRKGRGIFGLKTHGAAGGKMTSH